MNKIEQIKYIYKNYELYTHHTSSRKIRHDFFSKIETELQAYMLGFFASDGSINEKRKTFRIHLQERDSDIVLLFKHFISPDARTFYTEPHNVKARDGMLVNAHRSFGVDIASSKLCNDLVNLGFGYRKSYCDLHLPNIKKDLLIHFIRGYFDGDGSFSGGISQPKHRKNKVVRMYFTIESKKVTILNEIQKYFIDNYNIYLSIIYLKRDNMYRICSASKNVCRKLFHIFYDDANFYLQRKFLKFNYYANTEDVQLIANACNAQKMSVNESNNSSKSSEHPKQDENIC